MGSGGRISDLSKERRRAYSREWHAKNKAHSAAYGAEYRKRNRDKINSRSRINYVKGRAMRGRLHNNIAIIEAAKNTPCADCAQWFPPVCMDFDHVRGVKVRGVGLMVSYSTQRLLDEIAKCDVVCAICHRLRTYARRHARKDRSA